MLSAIIVETGIDYLSMSLDIKNKDYAGWLNRCLRVMTVIADRGNELRYGSFQGYEGWYVAGAFYGDRTDGAHIHLPGVYADLFFSELYHQEAHYSRLDLQTTLKIEPFELMHIEREEKNAIEANERLPGNRKRLVRLVRDSNAGRTLYIGVRTSPVYCRLYNKEAKSTDEKYTHCWRYEIELHNDMATRCARRLHVSSAAIYALCASLVWQTFKDRGIEPPYTKEQEAAALPPSSTPESDIDKKLHWLSTQVKPCVQKLLIAVGYDIVSTALGLSDTLPVEP